MRKGILLIILGLCFFMKAHAQNQENWTETEKNKVEEEIGILEEYFTVTESQKESLRTTLLNKNRFLADDKLSVSRRNWTVEHGYLEDLRYILTGKTGEAKAAIQMKKSGNTSSESSSERVEEVLHDETLLKKLNLHQTPEEK